MERDQLDRISHMVQLQDIHLMLKGKYTDLVVMDSAIFDSENLIGMKDWFQNIGVRHFDTVIGFTGNMVGKYAYFF